MSLDSHGLDRIRRIPASDAIGDEARRFTPWLGRHLDLLAEAVGIDLSIGDEQSPIDSLIRENTEVAVGTYRLDIRAFTDDERVVAIENQYGTSDHSHLGQVITYASGVAADVVIWIAESFTEPHLDAIRWLNARTDEDCGVFAVEIEFLSIGGSHPAPALSVREKPSEWVRSTRAAASKPHWTKASYLDAITDPHEREAARSLIERVEASGRVWYGVKGGGELNLHYRQNCGPVALSVKDGSAFVRGLWTSWNRSRRDPAYGPVARVLGQSLSGPSSSVNLSGLDMQALWLAIEQSASQLRGLPDVEPID